MGSEKYKKILKGLEWLSLEEEKDSKPSFESFNSVMILFKDGEFMLQPSDCEEFETLQSYDHVHTICYLNEENRIDCLHTSLLFLLIKANDKSRNSFLYMQFTYDEFFELYGMLNIGIEEKHDIAFGKIMYTCHMPTEKKFNMVRFDLEGIVEASKTMLKLLYNSW